MSTKTKKVVVVKKSQPSKGRTWVRTDLDEDVHRVLRVMAADRHVSYREVISIALMAAYAEHLKGA